MNTPLHRSRRLLATLPLILFLLLTAAIPATSAPASGEDTGESLQERLLEHRSQEAEMKAALARERLLTQEDHSRNQADFDVQECQLILDLNPTSHILTGSVTTAVEVTGGAINTVELNLDTDMVVSSVTAGGVAGTFTHVSNMLTIDLDRTYTTGEIATVVVNYSGNPAGGAFGWSSYSGEHMIWTLSEPFGARSWWPCKDLNSDKVEAIDIIVTVPDNLVVASNGTLLSDVDNGATRTFHWHSDYPIATYLVSLAIYPYTVYSDWYTPLDGGDPMEVAFYVFPDHYDDVQINYAKTVPMLEVFAGGFGEYPFVDDKYGHAEFLWGGGMEHQTITSLGGWWEDVISHEAAHQWWGDGITCDDFGHIWLNEGFAVWCEAYWKEMSESFSVYQDYMEGAAYFGGGTIFIEDPLHDNIFDVNLSYNKGSWVVHMLRGVLGDEDFFTSLEQYLIQFNYDSATTEDLRDLMESISGIELDQFFQQWIYGEYFPVYSVAWTLEPGGEAIELTVEQIQTNTGLFTMPIRVRVITSEGTTDHLIQNSLALESYSLPVNGEVESVQLDPDKWILRQIQTGVSSPTFDQGILVVNGVDWNTYGEEILSAYADSCFWGDFEFDFWDTFSEPAGGYPANLPTPVGFGGVPGDVIGHYSSVVWVGNNYNGDINDWFETPILTYIELGGNVMLLTRRGNSFLGGAMSDYLGITWAETEDGLGNCVAVYPGLVDIPFTGTQSWNDVFHTSVGPNSTLLLKDTTGFSGERGTGVQARQAGGGTVRPEGANFIYIAGRPYRMNHDALRSNVEFLLEHLFLEPWTLTAIDTEPVAAARSALGANFPNPFNPRTTIPFTIGSSGHVELSIFDVSGRLVRTLIAAQLAGGEQKIDWDGNDDLGNPGPSGIYFVQLKTGEETSSRAMVLLR